MVAAVENLHPSVVEAIVRNAELRATFVGELLTALDKRLKADGHATGAQDLPAGFLLELGAIGQLYLWELAGLREFLPDDLPTSNEAMSDLLRRAQDAPLEFRSIDSARLSNRVTQVHVERSSWVSPELLEAEVVLSDIDEDQLVDVVAHLLWDHRNDAR